MYASKGQGKVSKVDADFWSDDMWFNGKAIEISKKSDNDKF